MLWGETPGVCSGCSLWGEAPGGLLWGEAPGLAMGQSLCLVPSPAAGSHLSAACNPFSPSQVALLLLKLCCMESCSCRRKSNGRGRSKSGTGSSLLFMPFPHAALPGHLLPPRAAARTQRTMSPESLTSLPANPSLEKISSVFGPLI